jgi:hypothetical protein
MIYWNLPNNNSYVSIERNGFNTAIGEAILEFFYPELYKQMKIPIEQRQVFKNAIKDTGGDLVRIIVPCETILTPVPGLAYYYSKKTDNHYAFVEKKPPHTFMPQATESTRGVPHALIRHPVERFKSFVNRWTPELHMRDYKFDMHACIHNAVTRLDQLTPNEPFQYSSGQLTPQVTILNNIFSGIRFYKYPEHINNLVEDLQLLVKPVKETSTLVTPVTLTPAHEAAINKHFKADLDLYGSITNPGTILAAQGLVVRV